jgi:uncharacterized protein
MRLFPRILVIALAVGAGACGATARATRPGDPTYAGTTGAPACHVGRSVMPLVIDLRPEERGALEVAMGQGQGLVVVAYDCKSLRILSGCQVEGTYGFLPMVPKEQVVRLENADEVRVNLPLGGAGLAAKLEGDLDRGSTLDIALIMVGKRMSTRRALNVSELSGRCDGATHVVRGATVGAFTMQTGTRSKAHSAAELFSSEAKSDGSSSKTVWVQDGSLDACRQTAGSTPPAGCGALLQVEMELIDRAAAGEVVAEAEPQPLAQPRACPTGYLWSDGKCTRSENASPTATSCDGGDSKACQEACDAGDLLSCANLAFNHFDGRHGVAKDLARSLSLGSRACNGGVGMGCILAGMVKIAYGDDAAAEPWFEKACKGGEAQGCTGLGTLYLHLKREPDIAARSFSKGCEGGDPKGCRELGAMYRSGRGVGLDDTRAAALSRRACQGGNGDGCSDAGAAYLYGEGVTKDERRAAAFLKKACGLASDRGCMSLGLILVSGAGIPKDESRGRRMIQDTCDRGFALACGLLGILHEKAGEADLAHKYYEKACEGGENDYCDK